MPAFSIDFFLKVQQTKSLYLNIVGDLGTNRLPYGLGLAGW